MVAVGRVEVDEVVAPLRRNVLEDLAGEIAMRVEERTAPAGMDVLEDEVFEERRLPRAGLADGVGVAQPVGGGQRNRRATAVDAGTHADQEVV